MISVQMLINVLAFHHMMAIQDQFISLVTSFVIKHVIINIYILQ